MKVVAFLPIKLNSQRLPHKNILPIDGKPLCWHLADTLTKVKEIDEVYAFCKSEEILNYIPSKVRFLQRDAYYDGENVKSFELIGKFIEMIDADVYVFANTTSPFLKVSTVENALHHILVSDYDSALTVQKFQTFALFRGKPINYDINDIPKTQDMEPVFIETSGFYMFRKEIFTKNNRRLGFKPYMQVVEGIEAVDIDTESDYEYAKKLLLAERMKS